jgi:hypothetical protein
MQKRIGSVVAGGLQVALEPAMAYRQLVIQNVSINILRVWGVILLLPQASLAVAICKTPAKSAFPRVILTHFLIRFRIIAFCLKTQKHPLSCLFSKGCFGSRIGTFLYQPLFPLYSQKSIPSLFQFVLFALSRTKIGAGMRSNLGHVIWGDFGRIRGSRWVTASCLGGRQLRPYLLPKRFLCSFLR